MRSQRLPPMEFSAWNRKLLKRTRAAAEVQLDDSHLRQPPLQKAWLFPFCTYKIAQRCRLSRSSHECHSAILDAKTHFLSVTFLSATSLPHFWTAGARAFTGIGVHRGTLKQPPLVTLLFPCVLWDQRRTHARTHTLAHSHKMINPSEIHGPWFQP